MKFAHVILAFLCAAGVAAAQQPAATVTVGGLAGCPTASGGNVFPVLAWSFGVNEVTVVSEVGGKGSTKLNFSSFSVRMSDDACSANLRVKTSFPTLKMTQYDANTGKEVMTIQLKNVKVVTSQNSAGIQAVSFEYGDITMTTYYPNEKQADYTLNVVGSNSVRTPLR